MIKALHNKDTGEIIKKEYPRKDNKPVVDLDKNLEWLEISSNERPAFNPLQFDCVGSLELTDGVVVESWELKEKTEVEVINNLNDSVGNWIDSNYELWEQNKHSGKALRYCNILLQGNTPPDEETQYVAYIQACADWAKSCRDLRDDYENDYKTTGNLPIVTWPEKPIKNI